MLVSIILPIFNRGYPLLRGINSVIAQSYVHWELIEGSCETRANSLEHVVS